MPPRSGHLLPGIRWMSLLGVGATLVPGAPADPPNPPVLIVSTPAGAFAVPLDDDQPAS